MDRQRVVVFDLDGTLIDSRIDVAIAHNFAVKSVGGEPREIEELFPLIGLSLEETYRRLLPPELHHLIGKAAANYKGYYFEHCMENTKPFPGTKEVLESIRKMGFLIAIATTKKTFMAKRVLSTAASELLELIDHVQGTDEFPHKPNPEILNRVSLALGGNAEPVCMVGDTTIDIRTGRNAGIKTCAAMYGYGDRTDLLSLKPDGSIESIEELPEHIEQMEF